MINNGKKLELNFVKNIDSKKYSDINHNLKEFLKFLFGEIDNDMVIRCYRLNDTGKADVKIKIGDNTRYISIKTGSENSVHIEKISSFITFLKELKVDDEIIDILKLYHYGDGTLDGGGKKNIQLVF